MSTSQIITIAVAVLVVAAIGLVLTGVRRKDVRGVGSLARETRKKDRGKVNPEAMTGRQVEAAATASRSVVLAAPKAEIEPWSPPDVEALGVTRRQFFNRASVTLMSASLGGFGASVIAFLWKGSSGGFGSKCPHLGCRVPECSSSQWFECPCHGSQYNRVGEKKGGPAPRGMDHFGVSVANGILVVDTGTVFGGPPIGTNTTGQEAEGPHCVGGGH